MADAPADLDRMTIAASLAGAPGCRLDLAFTIAGIGAEGSAKARPAGSVPAFRASTAFQPRCRRRRTFVRAGRHTGAGGRRSQRLVGPGASARRRDDLIYDVNSRCRAPARRAVSRAAGGLSGDTPRVDPRSIAGGEPTLLLALAGIEPPSGVENLGAFGLTGTLNGNADDMTLDVDLTALGGNASIDGTIATGETATTLDLNVAADHPEFKQLLAALSPDAAASAQAVGPLKFAACDQPRQNLKSQLDGRRHVTGGVGPRTRAPVQLVATLAAARSTSRLHAPGGGEAKQRRRVRAWSLDIDLAVLDDFDGTFTSRRKLHRGEPI
jgi:hypothetical protein